MTIISHNKGILSSNNSVNNLSTVAFSLRTNIAQSGTLTTIVLDTNASAIDDFYNNYFIEIIDGTAYGQVSEITDYIGSTKTATVNFEIAPSSDSVYVIHLHAGICQEQTSSEAFQKIKLAATESSTDDFYNNCYIKILKGDSKNSLFRITDYNGTTKVATLDKICSLTFSTNSIYAIYGESGTIASATSTSVVIADSHSSDDDFYNNMIIEIISGTGKGQTRTISDYVGTTKTCTVSTWTTNPSTDSIYNIYAGWVGSYENVLHYTQLSVAYVLSANNRALIEHNHSLTSNGSLDNIEYNLFEKSIKNKITNIASNYYRFRIISTGNNIVGDIQVIYHTNKNLISIKDINNVVLNNDDCIITKSILNGEITNNSFKNVSVTSKGELNVNITNPTSSFGELLTAPIIPVIQLSFPYKIENCEINLDYPCIVSTTTEGEIGVSLVQTITFPPASQFNGGEYFTLTTATPTTYYVWFDLDNSSLDPSPGGSGIEVNISGTDNSSTIAAAVASAIGAVSTSFDTDNTTSYLNLVIITYLDTGVAEGINMGLSNMPTQSGASVVHLNNSMVSLTNSATLNGYALLKSNRTYKYRSGQSLEMKFAGIFDSGETETVQIIGMGNQISGLFFGYTGTEFGILHRKSGQPHIVKLNLSAGATTNGTIKITLDGVLYSIDITSGTTEHNAYEIGNDINIKRGNWLTEVIDNSVIFLSKICEGARNKTYSFDANGVSTISGSFSTISTGEVIVNTWIKQKEWNINRLYGYGDYDMVLNPQKGNVYKINMQWLGYGAIDFYIENPNTGKFIPIHQIRYANSNTSPSMYLPFYKILAETYTTGSINQKNIKLCSGCISVHGKEKIFDNYFSKTHTLTTSSGSETAFLTFRNLRVFAGKDNNTNIKFKSIKFSNDGSKGGRIRFYLGGNIGQYDYQYIDENNSSLVMDTFNTSVPSGSRLIAATVISSTETIDYDINKLDLILHNNDTLTITIQRNTSINIEITASFTWQEDR